MKTAVNIIFLMLVGTYAAGRPGDAVGIYETNVPFTGHDPRFKGQEYVWRLELKADSTFSFATELPMAVYLNSPPYEMVTKAPTLVAGTWTTEGDTVLLFRRSGDSVIGSRNTRSFSFDDNCLKVQINGDKAKISDGENRLEMTKGSKVD